MTYVPAADRYDRMQYNRSGRRGLLLPAISLGLWQNFGADRPLETSRAIVRRAFDLGITHFDLANNYGPPYGSAEETFGRLMQQDLAPYRDELVISTKAGYDMWPGPYGDFGSRKYLLASLDQSLAAHGPRLRRHLLLAPPRPRHAAGGDAWARSTPRCGRARRCTRASRPTRRSAPREAAAILRELGTPLLIHQPSYSMLNRWIERRPARRRSASEGVGCIVFSPLAQGMLTDRYLRRRSRTARAPAASGSLSRDLLTEQALEKIRALDEIAARRGQTLAQMALAWTLRDPRVTSTLVGASSVAQLEANVGALDRLGFTRRRARRDRPPRDRQRHQPLGRLERRMSDAPAHAALRPARHPPADPARGHGEAARARPSSSRP